MRAVMQLVRFQWPFFPHWLSAGNEGMTPINYPRVGFLSGNPTKTGLIQPPPSLVESFPTVDGRNPFRT